MTIIDLTEILKDRKSDWHDEGIEAINSVGNDTARKIITFVLTRTILEVQAGLGLIDWDDDDELKIFEQIADVYEEAAGSCYFCSSQIDPNAQQFSPETKVCPMCALKLANFTQALGIDPAKVFNGMQPRTVQKLRIEIRE